MLLLYVVVGSRPTFANLFSQGGKCDCVDGCNKAKMARATCPENAMGRCDCGKDGCKKAVA